MYQTKVIDDSSEVDNRLKKFNVTKAELSDVVHQVVTARNQAVSNDPLAAAGLFAYIFGTRAIRELFLKKEWKLDRSENIESTSNKELGIRIVYQSAESASELNVDPRAVSNKGAGSKRMVASGQVDLLDLINDFKKIEISSSQEVWFFYVSVNGSEVCAELSRPGSIENGQFTNFVERIFIIKPGEFDPTNVSNKVLDNKHDEDIDFEEFQINISRKK
jgi:hypothetical protein